MKSVYISYCMISNLTLSYDDLCFEVIPWTVNATLVAVRAPNGSFEPKYWPTLAAQAPPKPKGSCKSRKTYSDQ